MWQLLLAMSIAIVTPAYGLPRDRVEPGRQVQLAVRIGAVQVEQGATAIQPARKGQRLFVKLSDGTIVSARLEEVPQ